MGPNDIADLTPAQLDACWTYLKIEEPRAVNSAG